MKNAAKIGMLYVLPGVIVLGAFFLGHKSMDPDVDRLSPPEESIEIMEPVPAPSEEDQTQIEGFFGGPEYQYFPYRTTIIGNIPGTNQLFSFEIAVALYENRLTANSSMDTLTELETQLTPMILDQALGMSSEDLLSKDGREALKLKIKNMLNDTLAKWGHTPFIHSVEITSFVVT